MDRAKRLPIAVDNVEITEIYQRAAVAETILNSQGRTKLLTDFLFYFKETN